MRQIILLILSELVTGPDKIHISFSDSCGEWYRFEPKAYFRGESQKEW